MNQKVKSALQVLFSLSLGVFLIWYIYKDLTEEDKANIILSFKTARYEWVVLSSLIAITSHIFRAYRWKYPLESLDIKIGLGNRFAAVMIGYLANLAFPRLGEVTRCAVLARYRKIPFEKLFGTVLAERLVDAVILVLLIFTTLVLQFDELSGFLGEHVGSPSWTVRSWIVLGTAVAVSSLIGFFGWRFLARSVHPVAIRFRDKLFGLVSGFATLKNMKGQGWFYFHTLMIWVCYVLMFVVTFRTFPETAEVPIGGVLAAFTLGGITIVAVQGGLGAYPLAIMAILVVYGVPRDLGYAFGWIVWSAQTATIIIAGFVSVIAMPLLNSTLTNGPETE
ncbi:MAG: lysylphosphatidylglycerol synthase transmembrane domain-containing protein [Salibacteraceae bacterium]